MLLSEYKMKYFVIFLIIILTFNDQNRIPGFFIQLFFVFHFKIKMLLEHATFNRI